MLSEHHVHPLAVPADEERPLGLAGVAAAHPQDLPEAGKNVGEREANAERASGGGGEMTCMGWQMRLRVGVSPGPVLSGRRLSSRPSSVPLSLLVLSPGTQLKKECDLWRKEGGSGHPRAKVKGQAAPPLTRGTPRCRTRRPG